ncbi:MAG: OmpH family outer membrane protein [Chlamydiales bacterium]
MKNLDQWINRVTTLVICTIATIAAPLFSQQSYTPPTSAQGSQYAKIAVLNTRKCLEESKMSKQERLTLEKMKNQMESVLKDKEKAIHTIENKLRDEDYMDSISEEAERELKHKKKVLIEEGVELNRQFSDNLEMTNMKIMQAIIEAVGKASKEVVQEMANSNQPIDLILTSEACTYFNPSLDITDRVLEKMDTAFEAEQKEQAAKNKP